MFFFKGQGKWLIALVPAVLLMLGMISWLAQSRIADQTRVDVANMLQSIRDATTASVMEWVDERQQAALSLATSPDIHERVSALLELGVDRQALLESAEKGQLHPLLQPVLFQGYMILGPGNYVMTADFDEIIGRQIIPSRDANFLIRLWNGNVSLIRPEKSPMALPGPKGDLQTDLPVMLVGAPMFDEAGEPKALLLFRIDPLTDFSRILERGRNGVSGDTYAFDETGLMLSESRFEDQLTAANLLSPSQPSALNVQVRDPGVDLTIGPMNGAAFVNPPLTRMAAAAVLNGTGTDVMGYRDYRGVPVVGAWTWLPEIRMGVATEFDVVEAYRVLQVTRSVVNLLTGTGFVLVLGLAGVYGVSGHEVRISNLKATEGERRVRTILNTTADGIISIDEKGLVQSFNLAAEGMFGCSAEEVIGQPVNLLIPNLHGDTKENYLANYLHSRVVIATGKGREVEGVKKNGEAIAIELSVGESTLEGERVFTGILRDITDRRHAEQALQRRADFDQVITGLSTGFISLAPDEIDIGIEQALAQICYFTGTDGCDVSLFSKDMKRVVVSHRYPAVEPDADGSELTSGLALDSGQMAWWSSQIILGHPVVVSSLGQLPEEAGPLRELRESQGIQSFLDVPIKWQDKVKGVLGFWAIRPRSEWTDEDLVLLTLASQMIGNALQRKRMYEDLRKLTDELEYRVELRTAELAVSEEKSRRSEQRLRNVSDNIPGAMYEARGSADRLLDFEFVSKGVEDIYGVDAESLRANVQLLFSRILEQDRPEVMRLIRESLEKGTRFISEHRVESDDGSIKWVRSDAAPRVQDDGTTLWTGFWMDVTERRRAEAEAREAEQKLRNVTDSIPGAVYQSRTTAEGGNQFEFISKGVEAVFGIDAEAAKADYSLIASRVWDEDLDSIRETLGHAISQGLPYQAEYRVKSDDQEEKWVRSSAVPQPQEDGTTIWCGYWIEISAQKQLEKEMVEARIIAEEAARARGAFLANMSHEVRTPMNGVLGMLELLMDTELTDEQRETGEVARSSAEALLVILNDILDVSKIEAGQLELEEIPFSLSKTISASVRVLALNAENVGDELILDFDPGVPDSVRGDPGRLRQIITNLVSNAIKFTQDGEVVVSVSNQQQVDGVAHIRFAVRDTGQGIPKDKLKSIFEAFTQADSSVTRTHGGTGLGLTICTRLVAQMGGELQVSSEPGQGSEFWFVVPMPVMEGWDGEDQRKPMPAFSLQNRRFMVVEDNAMARRIIREAIETAGGICDEVCSVDEGLELIYSELAAARRYDALVLDQMMPRRDGFEFAAEIHADAKLTGTRMLMLTSAAEANGRNKAKAVGITGYLTKPVTRTDLIQALQKLLGMRGYGEQQENRILTENHLESDRPSFNILMAEDNKVNQQIAAAMLIKRGHTVDLVENGRDAVERVKNGRYDIVLMDIQMPEMDGLTATNRIRAMKGRENLPILALTAHALADERQRCEAAGMNGFLTKPFKGQDLIAVTESMALANRLECALGDRSVG